MKLIIAEDRIPPSRGIIAAQNARGKPYASIDLKRWLRHNRFVFKTEKADFLVDPVQHGVLAELMDAALALDVAPSLRSRCAGAPPDLERLRGGGLHDLYLAPGTLSDGAARWFEEGARLEIPVRAQLQPPFLAEIAEDELADRFQDWGVRVVHLMVRDPLEPGIPCRGGAQSRRALARMQALAEAFEARDMEATIVGAPLCLVGGEHLVHTANGQQLELDHQYYTAGSLALAVSLHRRHPYLAGRALQLLTAEHELQRHAADTILAPWLLHRTTAHLWAGVYRRLTRPLRILSRTPEALPPSKQRVEGEMAEARRRATAAMTPACQPCRYRRICDHASEAYREALPGVELTTQEGELVVSPLAYTGGQRKYYDALDEARLKEAEAYGAVGDRAVSLMTKALPDRRLMPKDYGVENGYFERFEGGLKWFSVFNVEKVSTPLGRFDAPVTIAADFGGGLADYVGFSLGRHCKLVCPMERFRHTVALRVEEDGRYALLRDDRVVRPVEFEGRYYLPRRLGSVVEARLSVWNVEESITTHNIRVWTDGAETGPPVKPEYSIIIVSTRFTRRLQAVLRSIAHQEGVDPGRIEVVVCYVPGIDATDDLLDSVSLAYPELRIVRNPFPERHVRSKGFLINESLAVARGGWIVLLDSDTLLPPDFFAKVDKVKDSAEFIAPDGRKLLTPETTAKILLGEIEPWREWRALLNGAGEYRHREARGVPVGFCQCFKRRYLKELPYIEFEHFEWADMAFGKALIEKAGTPKRLAGVPVLHLDHGSSQWFGTPKHL